MALSKTTLNTNYDSMFHITDDALKKLTPLRNANVLVTGGCGFLGHNLCQLLNKCGAKVVVLDLACNASDSNIRFVQGSLLNMDDLRRSIEGCEVVFHTASPSPLSKNKKIFEEVNVTGTKNVIRMCEELGVKKLVYVSSASVVFDGTDQFDVDEEESKHFRPLSAYAQSKLEAERVVLSNRSSNLAVCVLRPHSLFGPGDNNFVPSLIKAAKSGKNRFYVGSGNNLVNFTYVDNVSYALALAAVALSPGSKVDGQVYFITNKEIVVFWEFLSRVYRSLGFSGPSIQIPETVMDFSTRQLERLARVLPGYHPTVTVETVKYTTRHHFYRDDKATRDFGYAPLVSLDEGLYRNKLYFIGVEAEREETAKSKASFKNTVLIALFALGFFYLFFGH